MIGNETGLLLKIVALSRKWINRSETYRDIAAPSLKILCENFNPVKRYGKTNMTVFVLRLYGEKYWWGLTSFGQFITKSWEKN